MYRISLVFLIILGACTNKSNDRSKASDSWKTWVEQKKEDFAQEFSVPTIVHHIYLKDGEEATINKEDRGVRFVVGECKENCLYTIAKKGSKAILKKFKGAPKEENFEEEKEIKLENDYFLSYFGYDDKKSFRFFLYDLGQKDLAKKRKRYFFNYSNKFKIPGTFHWMKEPKKVVFSRSDGSQKMYEEVAKIKMLSTLSGELTVYNTDAGKEFDKKNSAVMLMFRDKSNNKTTYGAGRFLVIEFNKAIGEMKNGDEVFLDFNYSYNPPCATSTGFHCPLAQDVVDFEVAAGEKYYKYEK